VISVKQYLILKIVDLLARMGEMLGYRIYKNLTRQEVEAFRREADLDYQRRSHHETIQKDKKSP